MDDAEARNNHIETDVTGEENVGKLAGGVSKYTYAAVNNNTDNVKVYQLIKNE